MAGYEGLGLPDTGGGLLGGLNQGLDRFGQELQKFREKHEQDQKYLATSDMIAHYARTHKDSSGQPIMDEETWNKYMTGSKQQKMGLTHAIVPLMATDLKREMEGYKIESLQERANADAARNEANLYRTYMEYGQGGGTATVQTVPDPTNPGGPGIKVLVGPKGGMQQIRTTAPKLPKLDENEQAVLSWATDRAPTTIDKNDKGGAKIAVHVGAGKSKKVYLRDSLPDDLKADYDILTDPKHAKNPMLDKAWSALKQKVIQRMGGGGAASTATTEDGE